MNVFEPIEIPTLNFYINNDCNLSCTDCLTFNNLKNFNGYFLWKDSEIKNNEWSKYIKPKEISILGGEPFLNPDLLNWIIGIKHSFKDCKELLICTNGTLLDKPKIINLAKEAIKFGYIIDVHVHEEHDYERIIDAIENILFKLDKKISKKSGPSKVSEDYTEDVTLYYDGQENILFKVTSRFSFVTSSILDVSVSSINFYNNDPIIAHDKCLMKLCHYIVHGDLYKCPVVATGKELIKKFNTNFNDLIKEYEPCSPFADKDFLENFLLQLSKPIKQCSMCPIQLQWSKISQKPLL